MGNFGVVGLGTLRSPASKPTSQTPAIPSLSSRQTYLRDSGVVLQNFQEGLAGRSYRRTTAEHKWRLRLNPGITDVLACEVYLRDAGCVLQNIRKGLEAGPN